MADGDPAGRGLEHAGGFIRVVFRGGPRRRVESPREALGVLGAGWADADGEPGGDRQLAVLAVEAHARESRQQAAKRRVVGLQLLRGLDVGGPVATTQDQAALGAGRGDVDQAAAFVGGRRALLLAERVELPEPD